MQQPQLNDFGITRYDVEEARRAERRLLFVLLAASALFWSLYGLFATRLIYPLLIIRALVVGICLVIVTAFVLAIPARRVLALVSVRYRRVRRYTRACRRFRTHQSGPANLADAGLD